jgi:hypothetical protein
LAFAIYKFQQIWKFKFNWKMVRPTGQRQPATPPVRHHDYARLLELAHHLLPTRCFRTMLSELIGRSRTLLQRHLHVVSTIKRPKAATVFPFTTPSLPKAECFAATAILE